MTMDQPMLKFGGYSGCVSPRRSTSANRNKLRRITVASGWLQHHRIPRNSYLFCVTTVAVAAEENGVIIVGGSSGSSSSSSNRSSSRSSRSSRSGSC